MYHARKHSAKLSYYYYFQKCFSAQQASPKKVLIFIYFSINNEKDKINLCLDDCSPTGDCHQEAPTKANSMMKSQKWFLSSNYIHQFQMFACPWDSLHANICTP